MNELPDEFEGYGSEQEFYDYHLPFTSETNYNISLGQDEKCNLP